jgi:type I restriction enzyme S subunit
VTDDILPANTNQALSIIRLKRDVGLYPKFVLKALETGVVLEQIEKFKGGVAQQNLSLAQVRDFQIPLPPLAEQQRIVGLLDEAFEGLATAKANAEKNLQNARALFESHLQSVFTQRGEGWVEKPFEDCIEDVKYTTKIQRKDFLEEGEFPIVSQEAEFTNGYWDNAADVFKVTRPVVIFGDHTQVLKYIDFDFVLGADGVKLLPPKPFLNPKFFFYALRSAPLKSLGYARHYRLLKELQIGYPDMNTQVAIAKKLDALEAETQRLARLYERKLAALEELKKSLLHQAFSGEL